MPARRAPSTSPPMPQPMHTTRGPKWTAGRVGVLTTLVLYARNDVGAERGCIVVAEDVGVVLCLSAHGVRGVPDDLASASFIGALCLLDSGPPDVELGRSSRAFKLNGTILAALGVAGAV